VKRQTFHTVKMIFTNVELETDNYPRTWNRVNTHWSMSWTFPSANEGGNCCLSTKQGEGLAAFLTQLRLATGYSLHPSEPAATGRADGARPASRWQALRLSRFPGWADGRVLAVIRARKPEESELPVKQGVCKPR